VQGQEERLPTARSLHQLIDVMDKAERHQAGELAMALPSSDWYGRSTDRAKLGDSDLLDIGNKVVDHRRDNALALLFRR